MTSKQIIVIGVMAFLATIVYYSFTGGESPEAYSQQLNKEREEKNHFMKNDEGSPFYAGKDSAVQFILLNYYEPNLEYKVIANLLPIETKKMVVLGTSDGLEKKYLEYGFAEFTLGGQKNKLLLLEVADPGPYRGTLFLAFADATSGAETYGAGRYLDVKKVPGATSVTLDFNKAYNPYCAYSDGFSCPFPPKENILSIPIKAGEKVYH
ncbi:MAG: DUF1684 domain-containing protein [Cyclobacteriaceae bacterium]|jgi:uncharacterized protein (DUF1684 family)